MSDPSVVPPPRRRGRPRGRTGAPQASGRAEIVKAAAAEFAERGYETASLRAIARRAGVDAALVHHYFGDKAELFTETMAAPIRPDRLLQAVLAGPRDEIGANIVRSMLEQLEAPRVQTRIVAILRAALGAGPFQRMFKEFLVREVFLKLARAVGGDDAELRATLAASQIVGLLLVRFVLRVEPLAGVSIDQVVQRVGPVVQWHLTGFSADGPTMLDTTSAPGE